MPVSKALTKIQSMILVAVIVIAVGGSAAYILLNQENEAFDTIKVGVLVDLDGIAGKEIWQSVVLAAEQINAEGGLLGRQVEVFGEDNDGGLDAVLTTNALTRLITTHQVDFVIGLADLIVQEIIAQHKKIFIAYSGPDMCEQRVLDDYERYKYYFKANFNESSTFQGMTNSLEGLRQKTGFNKIGYIGEDLGWVNGVMDGLDSYLPQNGFELVYKGKFPLGTVDFSSYFAAAEANGVEAMVTLIATDSGIPFVKEYYDRQSPIFLFGGVLVSASFPESYEWTDGKCEYAYTAVSPICVDYPFTNKTLLAREAYIDRWGETPWDATGYDVLRFILADAIERAGTIETDALIEALEETSIETASARNFEFSSSHGVMMGTNPNDPTADYKIALGFQWQDGKLVPVDPIRIMEEAGATYKFPDWPGPWD